MKSSADGGKTYGARNITCYHLGLARQRREVLPVSDPNGVRRQLWACRNGKRYYEVLLINAYRRQST